MTAVAPTLGWRKSAVARLCIGLGTVVLLGSVAILPILPWPMGIVTDARHVFTAAVPAENRGAYLVTDQGAMQLFTWNVEPPDFPADAPTLDAGSIQAAAVVQKAFAELDSYRLTNMTTGHSLPWASSEAAGMQLTLHPAAELPPGDYALIVPSDGMFGGRSYHYFRIECPGREAGC